MNVLGVDPGRSGAAALITGGGGLRRTIRIVPLPFDDDGVLDYRAYRDLLMMWKPDVAYSENVWPRSKRAPAAKDGMGFITANKFMKSVGAMEGITACYVTDCYKTTPVSWKRRFGLLKTSKSASREMFALLWPQYANLVRRSKDDGIAEAGLIATYGAERQGLLKLEFAGS